MHRWFRRPHRIPGPNRRFRPVVEGLEDRCLLAAPVIDPITNVAGNIPSGKSLQVPVTASDADGNALTYSVVSSNPAFTAAVHAGNTFLTISVQGFGDMTFELFNDLAPKTVALISGMVKSEFYNGLTFHRIVKNFVIQGGDPAGNGTGGPGFTFDDEFNPNAIFSGNGQLAMANSGKDTNGSQFFVTVGPQRFLDFNHTIWGQLVRGFDVLTAINNAPADASTGTPTTPIVITRASIVQDTTDAVVQVKAAAGATGSATITVTANDGTGNTATQSFQVTAFADTTNDPAILGPVANQVTPVNTPVSFQLSSIDLENDPQVFEAKVTDATPGATASVNGNTVTVTPNAGFTGPVHLLVGAADQGATNRGSTADPFDTQAITVGVGDQTISATPANVTATEGAAATNVTVATFTDQDPNGDASQFTASINWGDGHVSSGTVAAGTNGTFTVTGTNTYREAGTFPVEVTVNDLLGATSKATGTATVSDAPLSAQPGAALGGTAGTPTATATVATFTDADPNATASDYTAFIDWGDNQTTVGTVTAGTGGTFSVLGSHTYAAQGNFTVKVGVRDVNTAGDVPEATAVVSTTAAIAAATGTDTPINAQPGPALTGTAGTAINNATVATFTFADTTAQATDFQAFVDWGDGQTTLGTVTATAPGAFSVLGSHTYAAQGNFTVNVGLRHTNVAAGVTGSTAVVSTTAAIAAAAAPPLTPNPNLSKNQRFVQQVYIDVLHRQADDSGLQAFSSFLDQGRMNRIQVVAAIQTSLEGRIVNVEAVYEKLLNRAADPGGLDASVQFLEHGHTIEQLKAAISGSPEYARGRGAGTNEGFLTALYQDAFNRAVDPSGLDTFTKALNAGASKEQVADTIYRSPEFLQDLVNNAYVQLLHRLPDPGGAAAFLNAVVLHGWRDDQLVEALAGSDEYFARV